MDKEIFSYADNHYVPKDFSDKFDAMIVTSKLMGYKISVFEQNSIVHSRIDFCISNDLVEFHFELSFINMYEKFNLRLFNARLLCHPEDKLNGRNNGSVYRLLAALTKSL